MFKLPHLANIPRLIYCAPNSIFGAIALRYSFEYGCQMPTALPSFPLFFADQDWKEPDRTGYMKALAKYKPNVATVLDFERPEQFDEVMSWAMEAARTHIRLKCTADSDANLFYERLGFQMVATEAGKVRRLNVWELHIKGGGT